MQANLDVMISFVIIVIALSVFLQIIMDVFKNLIGIKWRVYEGFMRTIYYEHFFDPETAAPASESAFRRLVSKPFRMVRHVLSSRNKKIGAIGSRITTFHHQVVAFLKELRTLKRRMMEIHRRLSEDNPDSRRHLIAFVHHNDLRAGVSRLRWKRLSAIFDIYFSISPKSAEIESTHRDLTARLNDFLNNLNTLSRDAAISGIETILSRMESIEVYLQAVESQVSENIENWRQTLEAAYERRIATWNLIIGLLLVIALNADAALIYATLRQDQALRANIIQHADLITQPVEIPSRTPRLNELNDTVQNLKQALRNNNPVPAQAYRDYLESLNSLSEAIRRDANAFNLIHEHQSDMITVSPVRLPFDLTHPESGPITGLTAFAPKIESGQPLNEMEAGRLKDLMDSAMMQVTNNYLDLQTGIVQRRKALLYDTDLPFGWTADRWKAAWQDARTAMKKIAGLLVTAIFISFGAPFWNDILKSLFGIRRLLRSPGRESERLDAHQMPAAEFAGNHPSGPQGARRPAEAARPEPDRPPLQTPAREQE